MVVEVGVMVSMVVEIGVMILCGGRGSGYGKVWW